MLLSGNYIIFNLKIESLALVLKAKSRKFLSTGTRRTLTQACRFCGMPQFVIPTFWSVFGRRPRATARLGRGSFAFIVLGIREPRFGKCNDLRLFLFPYKNRHGFLQNGSKPLVMKEAWFYGNS